MGLEIDRDSALSLWRAVTLEEVRGAGPDLTARQLAVLMTIYLTPRPHTVKGLSETLGMPKPAVTRSLDVLEELGFIDRTRDPDDRRNIFIQRTPAGAEHLSEFAGRIERAAKSLSE